MSRPAWLGAVAAGVALACAGPVLAQAPDQVAIDARVRVTVAGPPPAVRLGLYRGLTGDGLMLATGSESLTLPLGTIRRLEVYGGRRPGLAGGVAGLIVGGLAGGVAACAANRDSYGVFCAGQSDTKLVIGAALGGAAGAVLGALLFRRDRWVAVDPAGLSPARR